MPLATSLPAARRKPRWPPPSSLLYLAATYAVSLGWIGDCLIVALEHRTPPIGEFICAAAAAFWIQRSIREHLALKTAIRRDQAGQRPWSPTQHAWTFLAFSATVMVIVAVIVIPHE